MKKLLAALAACVICLTTRSSYAAPEGGRNVLLIGGGAPFRDAIAVALSSWGLHVVSVDTPAPAATMPRAAREARALTDRFGAAGLVWISSSDDEHALWVYDASSEQLVSRSLASTPPFDAPTAASAALSVKTLLRSSTVAPPAERIGADKRPPATEPAPRPREEGTLEGADGNAAARSTTGASVRMEIGGAARAVAGELDTRASLGASLWLGERQRLGLGLVGRLGPGLRVDDPRFRGRFDELGVSPSIRWRAPLGSVVWLEPRVGTTIHVTSVDGVAVTTARAATETRVDASADAGAVLDFTLTRGTSVGLDLEGSYVLRYQRYLSEGATVLELRPLQGSAGLRLALTLP